MVAYSIVSMSEILSKCSRNNEIPYVSLRLKCKTALKASVTKFISECGPRSLRVLANTFFLNILMEFLYHQNGDNYFKFNFRQKNCIFRNLVKNTCKTFKMELLLIWYLNKLFCTSRRFSVKNRGKFR